MRNFYSEGLLPTFRGRKHRFSFDLTANAYDGAPLSCNFHIFFYSMHFTKFTRRSSCPWENQKRKKVLGEKKNEKEIWTKEEREKEYHSAKKRKKFLRDSDQYWQSSVLAVKPKFATHNVKKEVPFLYTSTSLLHKH